MGKKQTAAEARRDEDFDAIMAGLNDAVAIAQGQADPATYRVHVPEQIDVKAIRKSQGMTQAMFALTYGLPKASIEEWEQRRRTPDTGSRLLLKVIAREPEAVKRALSAA
ncbi:MAG: helix-turn-helix domain-containing protein [Brevundimonas aurantiaca]|jgi:putative transcriptional regulator|uniref:helix-turn-helix domain-containing protein n=1 Tax=Brevundimonas aurantiaca TaxID=74316 RepID=UPI00403485BF